MIISVDHGNRSIKTPNLLFTSGLIESEVRPGIVSDCIRWNGRYYSLTEKRISYMRDKTADDRFYVLTLFAIAKELERLGVRPENGPIEITLLIGLPPAHYGRQHAKFEQYFTRRHEIVNFEYNGKPISIRFAKVASYAQALAAAVTRYGEIKNHAVAYVIDIGGFTVDVLKFRHGKPDLAMVESFENGMLTLYNSISSQINSQFALHVEDSDIDAVIRGEETILAPEVQSVIRRMTGVFISDLYNFLAEHGIDVKTSRCVFAGGGGVLLKDLILESGVIPYPIFIDDIHANAAGYALLYRSEASGAKG